MDNDTAALEEKKLLLEQYKAYLADLQQIGGRLETSRSFMLSILTLLFVFLSLAGKDGTFLKIAPHLTWIILSIAVVICFAWFLRIRTYNAIIKSKFTVLHEIEDGLPFKCFKREWELFSQQKPIFLTSIDSWIPIILAVAFALVVVIQQI
jgi:hypothetical protein